MVTKSREDKVALMLIYRGIQKFMKTSLIISLALLYSVSFYGQKKDSKKIIGTWVGPSIERYDTITSKSVLYQDTIIFFKDKRYRWTSDSKKEGAWEIGRDSDRNEKNELRLSVYLSAALYSETKITAEERRHPLKIIKLTRKKLKLETFISYENMNVIQRYEFEFTKIKNKGIK